MRHSIAISASAISFAGVLAVVGCKNETPIGGYDESSSSAGAGGSSSSSSGSGGAGMGGAGGAGGAGGVIHPGTVTKATKVDLLFSIDNSRSMHDKHSILGLALSDLVQSLVNPTCVDANGAVVPNQPTSGSDPCPAGSERSQPPVNDIHIGVISSSLGGHGADSCPNVDAFVCPGGVGTNTSANDKGHLLSRVAPCQGGTLPTYENKGFLSWDPASAQSPPGETDPAALTTNFKDIVDGAGELGCGYESQLESWYRFLVDPEPPLSVAVVNGEVVLQGIDDALLKQRAEFLRPDSFLMIVNLSDENDCSIREEGQYYLAGQLRNDNGSLFHLARPRSECAINPIDPCCKPCGAPQGNCPNDPTCQDAGGVALLTTLEDPTNLRCFDQKRRFGADFLYPVGRYVTALTSPVVPNRTGDLVPNPIFSDLNPNDGLSEIRTTALVSLTGIVGVPWQDVARDAADITKGFKTAAELAQPVGAAPSGWDIIVGDPASAVPPLDPYMRESIDPRVGANPITNDPTTPPGNPANNAINGSEYSPNASRDDLQFACVFNLPVARNCNDPKSISCDCKDPANDSPLCAPNPADGGNRTLQVRAKAYPDNRQLAVLKGIGGVVASICPVQASDASSADYAYRPAMRSISDRIAQNL